jgi:excisionase family DNA binding protein
MNEILLSSISLKEFETLIRSCVKAELQNAPNPAPEDPVFLTRKQTADILGISLPTLHDYTKRGLIPSYGIGTRIRYKKAEVEQSLTQVQKYRRG